MTISHKNLTGNQIHEPKDIGSASSGDGYIADGAGSGSWGSVVTAYSKRFASPLQVIIPGGPITIAHGLGGRPEDWDIILENVTPELGYTAGQQTKPSNTMSGASNQGAGIVTNATNLLVEYGNGTGGGVPVFQVIDRTTNNSAGITNANWNAIFIALKV